MLAIFYHDILLEDKSVHVHIHNKPKEDKPVAAQLPQVPQQELPPGPDPAQVEVEAGLAALDSIQKYVLFLKLLEFEQQLEFHNFNAHIDSKPYQECINYIRLLITFYKTFTLEQLTISINIIVDQINQLLSTSLKTNNKN